MAEIQPSLGEAELSECHDVSLPKIPGQQGKCGVCGPGQPIRGKSAEMPVQEAGVWLGDSSQILISDSRVYRREGARMCSEQHRHHSQGLTSHGVSLQLLTGCVNCGYEERGYWGWGDVLPLFSKVQQGKAPPRRNPLGTLGRLLIWGSCAAQFSVNLTQAGVICKEGTSTEKMTLPN